MSDEAVSALRLFRSNEGWFISDYQSLKEKIELRSLGILRPMKEIDRDITFPHPKKKSTKTLLR